MAHLFPLKKVLLFIKNQLYFELYLYTLAIPHKNDHNLTPDNTFLNSRI